MGQETKEIQNNLKTSGKMAILSPHISIITLNVNGLNSPIERHSMTAWIKKQDPTICCLLETHLSSKDKHILRVLGWKMILQANGKQKKAGVTILVDKVDLKIRQVKRDKRGSI